MKNTHKFWWFMFQNQHVWHVKSISSTLFTSKMNKIYNKIHFLLQNTRVATILDQFNSKLHRNRHFWPQNVLFFDNFDAIVHIFLYFNPKFHNFCLFVSKYVIFHAITAKNLSKLDYWLIDEDNFGPKCHDYGWFWYKNSHFDRF